MNDSEPIVIEGGCMCGAVRFGLTELPQRAGYCHCTRCQRRTGTGSGVSAWVDPTTFRLLSGADSIGGWQPPDGNEKCFCTSCGGHVFSRSPDRTSTSVRMGAFDSDPGVRPSYRMYVAYAAVWDTIPDDGLPRYDESRPV
jgi:hypothetical protein